MGLKVFLIFVVFASFFQTFGAENLYLNVTEFEQESIGVRESRAELIMAELSFNGGKAYRVVAKESKNLRAVLRLRMRGVSVVSGVWLLDGMPFERFREKVYKGQVRSIKTRLIPGLDTLTPGIHTLSVRLTEPGNLNINFPVLKYFVLAGKRKIDILTPGNGLVTKDEELPSFRWRGTKDCVRYRLAFSGNTVELFKNRKSLVWMNAGGNLEFRPEEEEWKQIKRNRWTYWKISGLDSLGNIVAESEIRELKIAVSGSKIEIQKISDISGGVFIPDTAGRGKALMLSGNITYQGNADYLVLRVFRNSVLVDQLLFRDVRKHEIRKFATSIIKTGSLRKVRMELLKISSPAVLVGIKEVVLR